MPRLEDLLKAGELQPRIAGSNAFQIKSDGQCQSKKLSLGTSEAYGLTKSIMQSRDVKGQGWSRKVDYGETSAMIHRSNVKFP